VRLLTGFFLLVWDVLLPKRWLVVAAGMAGVVMVAVAGTRVGAFTVALATLRLRGEACTPRRAITAFRLGQVVTLQLAT